MSVSEKPQNGQDVMNALGLSPDQGVIVALFPDKLDDVGFSEQEYEFHGKKAYGVVADLGHWGDRLLDVVTEPPTPIKWWQVKEFAAVCKLELLPTRWQGAITEIPERYFRGDGVLGIRLYEEGPWFWPLEKPVVNEAKNPEEGAIAAAVELHNHKEGYGEG
jgi:hypothetical protein